MSIIKLSNVSKFYYKKGVIASGFSRVNLEFSMGEFVAITGESGSGKSTLLNVISGLDTYEEGEMYINGEETSHFTEKDFEDYRRKYIGNIFQNFNLINSYSVYQNIELALLLNGKKKRVIKKEVLELIKKVGLYKFRKTKVSKLSGGQKQRVAIARALAKDTPIILADEPTGNLDSKSALEIMKLLSEVSKEKLVIVVTHNYEQVENYATRKIKMHDGRVLEDKKIKDHEEANQILEAGNKKITWFSKIRLAFRNTFNIIPKFLLLLIVYLFVTVAIISEYAFFKEQEYVESKMGSNYVFSNISDKRIIIKKKDLTSFQEEEYETLKKLDNVDYVIKNDLLIDTFISLTDNENLFLDGNVYSINDFRGELSFGYFPKEENEIIIEGSPNDYYLDSLKEQLLERDFYVTDYLTGQTNENHKLKVVGIKYKEDVNDYNNNIYMSDSKISKINFQINKASSTIKYLFLNKYYNVFTYDLDNTIIPNDNVPVGSVYISSDNDYLCPYEYCIGRPLSIEVNNIYYSQKIDLTVSNTYSKININYLLGVNNFDDINGAIFVNSSDYNKLFDKGNYQSSVFIKDINKINDTEDKLNKMGYNTLLIKDTIVKSTVQEIIKIISTIVTILLIIVLFFISYFVIRVILKSRNKYFSIIRILGATVKVSRSLLIYELLIVANISYFIFMLFIYLNYLGFVDVGFVHTIIEYIDFNNYLLLYVILIIMSYLISVRFASKLFKKSAISTLVEEV